MQVNDIGMDEFMTFCKLIDVEPYVTVNAVWGMQTQPRRRSST